MTKNVHCQVVSMMAFVLSNTPFVLSDEYAGFRSVDDGPVFSPGFCEDKRAAERAAQESKSVTPLLKLFDTYKKPVELAELEFTLGLVFSQRTGLTDRTQAIVHLTNALKYELPEQTRVKALNWRAGPLARLHKYEESLKDRLRCLLICSYYDFSGGMQQIKPSNVPLYTGYGSNNPENLQRHRDYRDYRRQLDFRNEIFLQRYHAIDAVKRLQKEPGITDEQIMKALTEVTPDSSRYEIIMQWLKSENKWPWPSSAK